MKKNQVVLVSITVFLLAALFFFIIVSEHGLADLISLRKERDRLIEQGRHLTQENDFIRIEIDRLKHDPEYIENVAREDLGMIGADEIIFKFKHLPGNEKK